MSNTRTKDAGVPEFAQVFVIFWLGAVSVSLSVTASTWLLVVRLLIVLGGLTYSIFASVAFIRPSHSRNRVALAVYPLCLFYFFIGWLIFVNTGPTSM
ncbi:unnamed protein product [Dibothriocephalus latus]|uniref:Protein YIPF n=1 Tax=Dibothriocephalus latus TaxID=60516 RepID=A0A3P7LGF9_DIBLA|nr:unnamed protein product [Dibothriocephalus latus]